MIKERKAPKDWENWEDFANCYDLVLFNQCINLGNNEVQNEWYEQHDCTTAHDNPDGDCYCEVFQWYAIACGDSDVEFLNKHFNLDIFYSEVLDLHILPVYHFGTAWDYVSLSMSKEINHD